ncbi:hypothetical protein CBF30_05650 [Vagococcus entomophilus]|uniref:Alpha/beta hydrolase n=2 Tax=Vagococcus entomophilus TaxID=1160095 RepID=A0A430AKR0_9ENTE|nr:hypothetical protein CBF30_05650 [Vagococcus entomophilus]
MIEKMGAVFCLHLFCIMEGKMKKIWWIVLLLSLVLGFSYFYGQKDHSFKSVTDQEQPQKENVTKSSVPTVFIHGYGGTRFSFGGMIRRFSQQTVGVTSIRLTVQEDGTIEQSGVFEKENNPLIQVLFEDNKNNEWNQAKWIKNVLVYLKEKYGVEKVNLVGHSMGGVSSLRYLLTYSNQENLPIVSKFVSIGAPFNNFIEDSRSTEMIDKEGVLSNQESERYQEFTQKMAQVSIATKILNIGGEIDKQTHGDGTVPIGSVAGIGKLLRTHGVNYQFQYVKGKAANHSGLHENEEVDNMVVRFLWGK